MPKIPVTFDDVKTLAERSKTKTLGDSDLIAVEIAQEIRGLTKEDALETLGINDLDGRVQYLEETALNNKADKDTDAVVGNFAYFDAEGNPVDSGKKDADYEDADATILKEADVVDSLESTSTTAPLSANQGKVLNDAIGEVEGRVETAESEIDELQTAETAIKGTGWTNENLVDHESRITQNESDIVAVKGSGWAGQTVKGNADAIEILNADDTTEGSVAYDIKQLSDALEGVGYTEGSLKTHEDRLDTLEGDDTTEGSVAKTVKDAVEPIIEDVSDHETRLGTLEADSATDGSILKSIKDNAENATFTPAVASGIESETLKEAVNELGGDVSDHETRIEALEETGGPPGPQGDDGLSAYEVAVEEGFVGDETAWLASLKGADGEEGKSAYDIYVETTSDSPVKTEEQWLASLKGADGDDGLSAYEVAVEEGFVGDETAWLASLKGADGKSAYEYAEEEGYEGTEGEFAEALADVENKIDKSKIVTAWTSPKNDEVPSASLVRNSLNTLEAYFVKDVVIIGSASHVSAGLAGESWEEITADNEAWASFWGGVHMFGISVRFLRGEYEIPTNIYFGENSDGRFAIPCGVATKIEGAGEDTVFKVGYPAGGTAFLSVTNHAGSNPAPCHISNLKIVNTGATTFGVVTETEGSSGSVVENVIVEDMIGAGILASWDVKNVTFRNCTTINCGSAFAGQQAVGIGVTSVDNWPPSNIKIDGCTVIGGAYAGIGLVGAEDCKVVNCHVEDYGKIGAGAMGGKRNIFANNTIIRDTQANPQSGEFGLLLNETDRAIVTGNIVENAHIMDNDSVDCLIENNIGDVL